MAGRPKSRPKPELPPFLPHFGNGRKGRKAQIEWLVRLRIEYGPYAFFDTKRHKLRYPLAETFLASVEYQEILIRIGMKPMLSVEEQKFLERVRTRE